jgi:hypothetical protein
MKIPRWTNTYAYGLALFCALALMALVWFRIQRVFDPFEHDYAEGIILYQILHIFNLGQAYRLISEYPHIVFHYTPLYHVTANLLGRTGLDTVVAARMISVAAMLALGVVCAALVWAFIPQRAGQPVRYAAALSGSACALFAASVASCGFSVRSDMLGEALSAIGLWTFVRSRDRGPMLWLAFALFTAGIYCKQTLISAPSACLIAALLISRRWFAEGISVLLVLGGGALGLLSWATRGKFLLHIFVYNVNPFSLKQAAEMIGQHVMTTWPVWVAGLAMIGLASSRFWLLRRRIGTVLRRSVRARILFCVALFTLFGMVLSLSTGKAGSAPNYFLEWDTGIAVLAGLFVGVVLAQQRAAVVTPAQWAALLLPLLWVLSTAPVAYRDVHPSAFMRAEDQLLSSCYSQLIPLIRAEPGPIISEDMMLLVKANKPIPLETAIFHVLADEGIVHQEPMLARLRRQQFPAIILIHELDDVFTSAMARTIADRYYVTQQIGPYRLYRPVPGHSRAEATDHQ